MLDLQITNLNEPAQNEIIDIHNFDESKPSQNYLDCYDSEILILFLHLTQIYSSKTEEDFLLNLAQEVRCQPGLYEALININKIMVKYAK